MFRGNVWLFDGRMPHWPSLRQKLRFASGGHPDWRPPCNAYASSPQSNEGCIGCTLISTVEEKYKKDGDQIHAELCIISFFDATAILPIMSSSAFQPHGLIKNPVEEALYHRAHIANVYTGIADPREHETSALMEVVLYSNIFTTRENFMVNSQQPPASQSDKRCDIVIRYLEQGTHKIRILCFVECKRTRTSQPFSLKALEKQATEYCILCLESEEDMEFVYAATMAGAHVRLWTCRRDQSEMIPFWGPSSMGDWSQYKDVGDDTAGQEIEYWFGQMKQLPPTPHAGQSSHTYGTASTITPSYQAPASSYQAPASGYQISASSYQAPESSYQAPASSYQAPVSGYQISASSYQAPTSVYQAPASMYRTSDYQASSYDSSTFPPAFQPGESVAAGGNKERTGDEIGDSEEHDEDDQMEELEDNQQATASTAVTDYYIVKVTRKTHRMSKDEFIFKDKNGRSRTTKQEDWRRTTYNGRTAWKHHKYVCFDDIFR